MPYNLIKAVLYALYLALPTIIEVAVLALIVGWILSELASRYPQVGEAGDAVKRLIQVALRIGAIGVPPWIAAWLFGASTDEAFSISLLGIAMFGIGYRLGQENPPAPPSNFDQWVNEIRRH